MPGSPVRVMVRYLALTAFVCGYMLAIGIHALGTLYAVVDFALAATQALLGLYWARRIIDTHTRAP